MILNGISAGKLPKHLRVWTVEEIRRLRELAAAGETAVNVAKELRRSVRAVQRRASTHGIRFREGRKFTRAWL
jgi:hypothetical protein